MSVLRRTLVTLQAAMTAPPRITTPPDTVIYAIGDVHGRADLLAPLLRWIEADAQAGPRRRILVTVGDYIDRGPASAQVMDLLIEMRGGGALETVFLRGNHEQALLNTFEDADVGLPWLSWGGGETLRSYGVTPPGPAVSPENWRQTVKTLRQVMPATHRRFLEGTELLVEAGDYIFVHAGLRPNEPVERQDPADLLEIREPFLSSCWPVAGRAVVFGHTPREAPLAQAGRLSLDTGAYATGVLSGVRLEGENRRWLKSTLEGVEGSPVDRGWT